MQYQFYDKDNQNYYQPPVPDRRSHAMETASLVLGTISIAASCCIYISIICGALAILFALLSRGGEYTMDTKAKIGLALGIAGILATLLLFAFSYISAISAYGSLEGILRAYCDMYGLDFEELYGDLFSTVQ